MRHDTLKSHLSKENVFASHWGREVNKTWKEDRKTGDCISMKSLIFRLHSCLSTIN